MNDSLLDGLTEDKSKFDPDKDYFQELVGEDKKFKDAKALARGKAEADLYIKTLEKQKDELRADYLKVRDENMAKARLEELIDQLNKKSQSSSDNTQNANDAMDTKPSYDPKEVESLIESRLKSHEIEKIQQTNWNTVKGKLEERYGENYPTVLKQQMEDLGLSQDDINALARKSPKAFFKTLGLDDVKKENFQAPPRSNVRSDNSSTNSSKRTWTYYQELKKANPKLYYDAKTTNQMHEDYKNLGEAFEDGDFKRYN